jgi:hypothetical protein
MEVSNAMMEESTIEADWVSYLRMYFELWKRSYVCYRIIYVSAQAHMSAAVKLGELDYKAADLILKQLRSVAPHHDFPEAAVSHAVLDFGVAVMKNEQGSAQELAKEFDDLALFHTYTNVTDE